MSSGPIINYMLDLSDTMRQVVDTIANPLTHTMHAIYHFLTGIIQNELKLCVISNIYMKGHPKLFTNYIQYHSVMLGTSSMP